MAGEDAQRELEQRALRNVRGLVERMENDDTLSRRKQVRMVAWLVGGAVLILVATLLMVGTHSSDPAPVDLKSVKAPEARPQGARRP